MTFSNLNANYQYALVIDGLPTAWYKADSTPEVSDDMIADATSFPASCWRYRGSSYSDYTTNVATPSSENFWVYDPLQPDDHGLIGLRDKFDSVDIYYGLSNTFNGTLEYSYWNGSSWVAFTPTSDGTSNGSTNGKIVLGDLPGWKATTVSTDTEPFYYFRIDPRTRVGSTLAYISYVECTIANGERDLLTGLASVSLQGTTFSPEDCAVEGGQVSLSVALLPDNNANELLRIGLRGSDYSATLAEDLTQTTSVATAVEVNEDISGWPDRGVLHIGLEAMAYSSRTTSAPWEFTLSERGYLNTKIRSHRALARVSSDVTNWSRRGARVYIASPDRGVLPVSSDWLQLVNGYLREAPQVTSDGRSVGLTVTPWHSALDDTLEGAGETTTLVEGWHIFDGSVGNTVQQTLAQRWEQGAAYNEPITVNQGTSAVLSGVRWLDHQDIFDSSLSSTDYANRVGNVIVDTSGTVSTPVSSPYGGSGSDGTGSLTFAAAFGTTTYPNVTTVKNTATSLDLVASGWVTAGTAAAVRWPNDVRSEINDDWTPGSTQGATGVWADTYILRPDDTGTTKLQISANYAESAGDLAIDLTHPNKADTLKVNGKNTLWYGFSLDDPDNPTDVNLTDQNYENVFSPLGWSRPRAYLSNASNATDAKPLFLDIVGFSKAFRQTGEQYILVADDIFPTATPFDIDVDFQENGVSKSTRITIIDKGLADDTFTGVPGYILEVDPTDKWQSLSFGIWEGQDAPVISVTPRWRNDLPWVVMLQLLMSSEGTTFNGTYDTLPYGLGLTTDEVDVASFTGVSLPSGAVANIDKLVLNEPVPVREFIDGMLRLNGLAIVTKRVGTERKLSLVSTGLTNPKKALGSVADADWSDLGQPVTHNVNQIINSITVESNQNPEGDLLLTTRVVDLSSLDETGKTSDEGIEAPWLQLGSSVAAQKAAILSPALDRFALFSSPRREFSGTIPYSLISLLDVGDTLLVSMADVWDSKGSKGLSNVAMRLLEVNPDLMSNSANIVLSYYPFNTGGWAPAAKGLTITSTLAITFRDSVYSDTTGVVDASYFREGDEVRLIPAGDYGSSVLRTINTITGSLVSFTAVHGLTNAKMTMRPTAWDSASTDQQSYVYLSDSSGNLGTSNDEGYDFG